VVRDVRLRRRKSRSAVRDVHEPLALTRPSSVEGVGRFRLASMAGHIDGTRSHCRSRKEQFEHRLAGNILFNVALNTPSLCRILFTPQDWFLVQLQKLYLRKMAPQVCVIRLFVPIACADN